MSDASLVIEGAMPLERLEAEIMSWAGNLAAANARWLGWIGEYDRREGWKTWGTRSCAEWLSWKCGESLHTAREKVRVARALEALPATSAALASGELSYSKVRAITRVATAADEGAWVEQARDATGAELDRLVAAVARSLDDDDPQAAWEKRRYVRGSGNGGTSHVKIDAPTDQVATIDAAVEIVASRMIDDAVRGTGRTRREVIAERGGLAAVRVDALVQMAEQIVAAAGPAGERGDIGRLQLVADVEAVSGIADDPEGICTLGGERIDPETARRWACDTRAALALDYEGHNCDQGSETRTINRRLRRALHRRDGGACRFPGCGSTSWLHAHHIVFWTDHGPTDLDNLVSLCGFHHTLVHEGGWTITLDGDHLTWTDPDGDALTTPPMSGDAIAAKPPQGHPTRINTGRWRRDRHDFHFAVAVIVHHCRRVRRMADVPAGTSPPEAAAPPNRG